MRNRAISKSTVVAVIGRVSVLSATLMLGACAQMGDLSLAGAKDAAPEKLAVNEQPLTELDKATEYWAKQNAKNPRDTKAALSFARNLKAQGRKQQALAVLQNSYMFGADDREYLSEYGRLALEQGQVGAAAKILERADDPARPDWRVISARGTVLAKQGDYKGAITFFERARELAPSQASVMNNLAMAYTMDGQAEKGEALLRQASESGSQDPRVKQNLALVLGLQGKHQEARSINGDPEGDTEPGTGLTADPDPQPTRVAASAMPKAQPAVARVPAASPSKPTDPDEIIRAAIEADLARSKGTTPISTSAAPRKKSNAAPVKATVINAQAGEIATQAHEAAPSLRPTSR